MKSFKTSRSGTYHICDQPSLEITQNFSCSTELSMKFIMLINGKMPTFVGILTSISMINTTSESAKQENIFICQHLSFYKQLKFYAQLS